MYYTCCLTNQYCRCGRRVYTTGHVTHVTRNTPQRCNDSNDNFGQIGIDNSGHLDIDIGNGLAIDLANGDLVVNIPGADFGIDTGW